MILVTAMFFLVISIILKYSHIFWSLKDSYYNNIYCLLMFINKNNVYYCLLMLIFINTEHKQITIICFLRKEY